MADLAITSVFRPEITDSGRIRFGASCKRLPTPPAAIADSGRIRVGASCKRVR